ncbi:putative lipase atg15 [Tulasnella sp. 427]|nr:putative lipase atg15 [Tulasnella sp. 427]
MLLSLFLSVLSLTCNLAKASPAEQHSFAEGNPSSRPSTLAFSLAYEHGQAFPNEPSLQSSPGTEQPLIVFKNRQLDHNDLVSPPAAVLKTKPMRVRRPRSQTAFHAARQDSRINGITRCLDWDDIEVPGPDIEDRETLLELAKITGNAYALDSGSRNWYPLDGKWNSSTPFGWEVDDDGFRGHVFATADNSSVILSIKGTTLIGGPTVKKDKINDNRLFSCCCGYVNWRWRMNTVCDCYSSGYRCNNECIRDALMEDSVFYTAGVNLYNNLTYLYPTANIWIVGHSLGGALASLLGSTFGVPVVGFEAPGERMAAKRLHLPMPPPSPFNVVSTYHVYHTADPVPLGVCTGWNGLCSKGGYALETRCHLGKSIVYDTVEKKGWFNSLARHPIKVIITQVLNDDWGNTTIGERPVPEASSEEECVECFKWEYIDGTRDGPSEGCPKRI